MASTGRSSLASVLQGRKDLSLHTRDVSPPGPGEVQIIPTVTTLCGSDLHYYNSYANGPMQIQHPLTLGHEASGTVCAVGPRDTSIRASHRYSAWYKRPPKPTSAPALEVGDRVAIEPGVPCNACDRCADGRYNICKDMRFLSSARSVPHAHGTLQSCLNHPAAYCHKLPDHLTAEDGALLEPLSVAVHAMRRAWNKRPPRVDSRIIVFGAGAIGLLICFTARILGHARRIVIVDVDSGRVDFALKGKWANAGYVNSAETGRSTSPKPDEDGTTAALRLADEVKRVLAQDGREPVADVVFDCTGSPTCVRAAIYATRPGGKVVLVGMGTPSYTLPVSAAALREVDIVGVFRYADTYPLAIKIIDTGRAPLKSDSESETVWKSSMPDIRTLITHRYYGLDKVEQAFVRVGQGRGDTGDLVIKVAVHTWSPEVGYLGIAKPEE